MFIHGLIVTWHLIGKPHDNISEIMGVLNGKRLFVRTFSGDIYSPEYINYINRDHAAFPGGFCRPIRFHLQGRSRRGRRCAQLE